MADRRRLGRFERRTLAVKNGGAPRLASRIDNEATQCDRRAKSGIERPPLSHGSDHTKRTAP